MATMVRRETALLRVTETADVLGVHPNTVRNWIEQGVIKAVYLPGSNYRRLPAKDVEALRTQMLSGEKWVPAKRK